VDRQTDKAVGISLWETEAALRASNETRRPIVAAGLAATGRTEQEVASYEVVISPESHSMPTAPLTGAAH
jgi:hypothetical protein